MTSARLLALSLPSVALLAASPAFAAGRLLDLQVARGAGAGDCPDATALSAAVARVVGHDVRAAAPSANDLRIEVAFAHHEGRYVATLRARDADREGERTISHESPTCASLAEAVAATLGLRIDDETAAATDDAQAAPALPPLPPSPEPPSPPAAAPAPPAAPDPDDVPPRDHDGPVPRIATERRWYGWQILAGDATAVTLVFLGAAESNVNQGVGTTLGVAGFAGLVTGGAIVHAVHRQWWWTATSTGLRIGLPLVGGLIGTKLGPSCNNFPATYSIGAAIAEPLDCWGQQMQAVGEGAMVGMLLASSIDVAALAWDRVPVRKPDAASGPALAPIAAVVPGPEGQMTAFVGISGSM